MTSIQKLYCQLYIKELAEQFVLCSLDCGREDSQRSCVDLHPGQLLPLAAVGQPEHLLILRGPGPRHSTQHVEDAPVAHGLIQHRILSYRIMISTI